MMQRCVAFLVVASIACVPVAFALDSPVGPGGDPGFGPGRDPTLDPALDPPDEQLAEGIRQELQRTTFRRSWFLGARYSHPQKLSGSVGWIFSRQPEAYGCGTVCDYRGWTVAVEPGIGGGKLSGGYGRIFSVESAETRRLQRVYLAAAGRLALLRTWREANLEPPSRTFVGVEAAIAVTQVQLNVGVFHRVSSGDGQDDWLVSAGLGYGF